MDLQYYIAGIIGVIFIYMVSRKTGKDGPASLYGFISGLPSPGNLNVDEAPVKVRIWSEPAVKYARQYNIPPAVVLAQIWQESGGRADAIGAAGEVGLMQLKEIAVRDLRLNGYEPPADWRTSPESNIKAGVQYLNLNMKPGRANGDLLRALGMYNQGPSGVDMYPNRARQYINEVLMKAEKLGYFI